MRDPRAPVASPADSAAFEATYRRTAPAVLAYARRRLANPEDAEDVLVEVFTIAWRRRHEVGEPELPWLYATAAHVIAHTVRAQTRQRRLVVKVAAGPDGAHRQHDNPEDDLVGQLTAAADVAGAFTELSESDQELLRLWAWEDLDGAQLAQVLGCTPSTARARLHRARRRMRAALAGAAPPGHDSPAPSGSPGPSGSPAPSGSPDPSESPASSDSPIPEGEPT